MWEGLQKLLLAFTNNRLPVYASLQAAIIPALYRLYAFYSLEDVKTFQRIGWHFAAFKSVGDIFSEQPGVSTAKRQLPLRPMAFICFYLTQIKKALAPEFHSPARLGKWICSFKRSYHKTQGSVLVLYRDSFQGISLRSIDLSRWGDPPFPRNLTLWNPIANLIAATVDKCNIDKDIA